MEKMIKEYLRTITKEIAVLYFILMLFLIILGYLTIKIDNLEQKINKQERIIRLLNRKINDNKLFKMFN